MVFYKVRIVWSEEDEYGEGKLDEQTFYFEAYKEAISMAYSYGTSDMWCDHKYREIEKVEIEKCYTSRCRVPVTFEDKEN